MTDENIKLEHEDNEKIQTVDVLDSQDWLLEDFIQRIISIGIEVGVTITVGGSIISGNLITGKRYFEEVSKLMLEAKASDQITEFLSGYFKEFSAVYTNPLDASEDWSPPRIGYIHLEKACYISSGKAHIPTGGCLWRGKLSSVDGFSIGLIGDNR